MCLGLPGKLVAVAEDEATGMLNGRVEFGGVVREVSLACTPEAKPGDYVLVHAGFAINRLDEREALELFEYLRQIDELNDAAGPPEPGPGAAPGGGG